MLCSFKNLASIGGLWSIKMVRTDNYMYTVTSHAWCFKNTLLGVLEKKNISLYIEFNIIITRD